MMDDEADRYLGRRATRLKRHWHWILAGAGLCSLASFAVSLFLPKVYRATTNLLVSESKIGPGIQLPAWQYATMPTYIPYVDNDALINQAVTKFSLDKEPYNLTVNAFRRKNILDVRTPKSTRLLEINVEFPDARLAAGLANYLAEGAVEFNDRINATDTMASRKFLERQLSEAEQRLSETATRRTEVRVKARIEDREKGLSILLSEKEQLSTQLQALRLGLAQDESKSKYLEQALNHEPRTFRLTKSILADRYLERTLGKQSPNHDVLPSITEEVLNTTQEEIRHDFVETTAKVAAENAGVRVAAARLQQVNAQTSNLVVELTRLRNEVDMADHDYMLAREAVDTASRNYQSASVNVSSKSQDIEQLAPALVPDRPVKPRLFLNTLLGVLVGLVLFSAGAAGLESFRELREGSKDFVDEEHHVGVRG